ncbi:MAG: hypothetical protein RBR78_05120, partial [Flavobacteriaceae bacterium]|nr:hypothetical protein [Flavobacteriaceae bacterium]
MKKILLLNKFMFVLLFQIMFWTSYGQTAGFNSTFLVLSINGGSNTYYDLHATTGNPDFNGANLGTFCQGSSGIVFRGAEHNNWKCGGCDITSTTIYYRVYLTSSTPGSFIPNNVGWVSEYNNGCGGADQRWERLNINANLTASLSPGNYTLEAYSSQQTTCSGTQYASNGGANYKATFTINANVTYYADLDGDGFGDPSNSVSTCSGAPVGYVTNNSDCDDNLVMYAD